MDERQLKLPDVHLEVLRLMDAKLYYLSDHAKLRAAQRGINPKHIRFVLRTGKRLESKDEFSKEFGTWKYVMQGMTADDGMKIRVVFTIQSLPPVPEDLLVVVTAIVVE